MLRLWALQRRRFGCLRTSRYFRSSPLRRDSSPARRGRFRRRSFDQARLLSSCGLRCPTIDRSWALSRRRSFGRDPGGRIEASFGNGSRPHLSFRGHPFRMLPCPTCPLRRRDPRLSFRTHRPSFGRAELARIEARPLVLRTFRPPTSRGSLGREAFGNGNGGIESTQQASDLRQTGDLFIDS